MAEVSAVLARLRLEGGAGRHRLGAVGSFAHALAALHGAPRECRRPRGRAHRAGGAAGAPAGGAPARAGLPDAARAAARGAGGVPGRVRGAGPLAVGGGAQPAARRPAGLSGPAAHHAGSRLAPAIAERDGAVPGGLGARGSTTVKQLPWPTALSTSSRPP